MKPLIVAGATLTVLAACAPFNAGGAFNPVSLGNQQTLNIGRNTEAYVQYNHAPTELEGIDFAAAFIRDRKAKLSTGRELSKLAVKGSVESAWSTSMLRSEFKAVTTYRLEQLDTTSVYEELDVSPQSAQSKFSISVPLSAPNGPNNIAVVLKQGGASVKAILTLNVASRSTSSEAVPFEVHNGDMIDVQAGKTTYINMSFDDNAMRRLTEGYVQDMLEQRSIKVDLSNPYWMHVALPKGLSLTSFDTSAYADIDSDTEDSNNFGFRRNVDFVPTGGKSNFKVNTNGSFEGGPVVSNVQSNGSGARVEFMTQVQ